LPRTTHALIALLTVICAASAEAQTAAAPIRLENEHMRVVFDAKDGRVIELVDRKSGKSFVDAPADTLGVWDVHAIAGGTTRRVRPADARRFRWSRTHAGATPAVRLIWDDFGVEGAPALRVTATVRLRPRDAMSEWRIRLDGIQGAGVDSVRFPRIGGIPVGERDELAVPQWMGQRTREPRRVLAGPGGKGRRLEWFYPGQLSLQAIALYESGGPGLYLAADDTLAYRKSWAMWGDGDRGAGYEMVHLPEDPGKWASYAPRYSAIVGAFTGDWMTAAGRYRAWGTQQRWARESRMSLGRVPAWVRNTGIWVWNRGESDMVLAPAESLQKRVPDLPVSVFWHWWHHGPYDTSFPDYLPPREGVPSFTRAVERAHASGLHAIVYMNQRLWCLETPSWKKERGERWAVRDAAGKIRTEVYNTFDPIPCATMDVATQGWRDKYAGIADTAIRRYGVDGIYMDQAVLSLVCYATDHGHPVGGGHYWVDGFTKLAQGIRQRSGPTIRPALAGEGGGENWLPQLDAFLTLQVSMERYADPTSGWEVIPFFQAVYHPYAITYGTYGSLTYPPYDELWPEKTRPANALTLLDDKYRNQFYLEQARGFVWGMQTSLANFLTEQLDARSSQIDYVIRLARLRTKLPQYFLRGTMLPAPQHDAPEITIPMSRISIYASRTGGATELERTVQSAITGAWRSPSGNVAIAVASIVDDSLPLTIRIDPARYNLLRGTRVFLTDVSGPRLLTTLKTGENAVAVALPPRGAAVLELVR
jgi:hypothetical protein